MIFKKPLSKEEILQKINDSITIFQKRSQNYDYKSQQFREKAKHHLRNRNREAAKSALKRWFFYSKFSMRYLNYAEALEKRLIIIDEAQTLGDLKESIKLAGSALESMKVSNQSFMETIVKQEEIMRELDQAADALASGAEEDIDVTEELNKLEAEIALEMAPQPPVPETPPKVRKPRKRKEKKKKEAA